MPLQSCIDVVVIWKYWQKIRRDLVLLCLPGGILGVLVASFSIGAFDPASVKLIVAVIALWFSGLYYFGDRLPRLRLHAIMNQTPFTRFACAMLSVAGAKLLYDAFRTLF